MLFNSVEFIFFFLPFTFFFYHFLLSQRLILAAKAFLVFASLFFYSWWNISYLPILLSSILFNYVIANTLNENIKSTLIHRKVILIIGISANIALLGYFKYADFFIENFNLTTNNSISMLNLLLPLAISFFTFQQIAYLVDSYQKDTKEYDFLNYVLFVTFFPQLIAGPIVHHKEMMPQFSSRWNLVKKYKNISLGLFIFSIGLFKKIVIADTFAVWASNGFDHAEVLTFFEAWVTSLSYTFQLYFDFSGYTDMAIGAALLFNIRLPNNFNSPYKATNIQDFWHRWHITLSRFLRDYVYIPLGGNRNGRVLTHTNLILTFLIGGIWHGAGWPFIFWGLMHGLAISIHRLWKEFGLRMPTIIAWIITFNFINITWVFFRANEWHDAMKVLNGMFFGNVVFSYRWENSLGFLTDYHITFGPWLNHISGDKYTLPYLLAAFIGIIFLKNSASHMQTFRPNRKYITLGCMMILATVLTYNKASEFLYFNF